MSRSVRKSVLIRATPQRVWQHLVDPELLAGWLMANDFEPRVGARFRFTAAPKPPWNGELRCEVLECVPVRRLVYSWESDDLEGTTVVSLELTPEGEHTRLELVHEGAPSDDAATRHDDGWADHLALLRRQAEPPDDTEAETDWTRFRIHLLVDAPVAQLFEAWSTPAGWESFFIEMMQVRDARGHLGERTRTFESGDRYTIRWIHGPAFSGDIREVVPGRRVVFTFGEPVEVAVDVWALEDGRSVVRLEQFGMRDGLGPHLVHFANCRVWWGYFLVMLKARLEHELDLRDPVRTTAASLDFDFVPPGVEAARS
ncbi:MAG: SRPBCC domain-containing protein [Myxococcales bacterium]|nr:SRPBCC domain-containing protein [Myxococcales bacterium]